MSDVISQLRVDLAEFNDLSALFQATPKKGRQEVARALNLQAEKFPLTFEQPVIPDATAIVAPALGKLDPVDGIFDGMVWGENRAVFVQLEHLVNEMRENATTYRLGLFGPPSAGKTLTAGRIARALERRYSEGSATFLSEFSNPIVGLATLVERIHEGKPVVDSYLHDDGRSLVEVLAPTVFFVDEAHEMPKDVQNALLPITERPYRAQVGSGYLDFRHIMFIFGTTDPSDLLKALRTRLKEFPFVGYSAGSVAKMVKMHHPEFSTDEALWMARAGKLYPRRALSVAQTCAALASRYGSISAVMLDHLGVDHEGLDPTDRRILEALDSCTVAQDPRKVDAAARLVRMAAEGARVNASQLAQAEMLLSNPRVHRPIGKSMLAEKIMSTDSRDIFERVAYLETLGKVIQSSRGVQLAV